MTLVILQWHLTNRDNYKVLVLTKIQPNTKNVTEPPCAFGVSLQAKMSHTHSELRPYYFFHCLIQYRLTIEFFWWVILFKQHLRTTFVRVLMLNEKKCTCAAHTNMQPQIDIFCLWQNKANWLEIANILNTRYSGIISTALKQ